MPRRSNDDLLAIKNELATDPKGIGDLAKHPYLPHGVEGNDRANSSAMNEVRGNLITVRDSVESVEIIKAITLDDFTRLSAPDSRWLELQLRPETIDLSTGSATRAGILDLFDGRPTRAAINNVIRASTSRSEQMRKEGLLEADGKITASDIANARDAT